MVKNIKEVSGCKLFICETVNGYIIAINRKKLLARIADMINDSCSDNIIDRGKYQAVEIRYALGADRGSIYVVDNGYRGSAQELQAQVEHILKILEDETV